MAENENMECDICGGTDFYKEAGYFYCNECQTQSQEVREHVFEEEITELKGIKKIKKDRTEKLDSKITSWECYNIVMSSLTDQLINLGADKALKSIVKCLWMKYLQKLEVFDLEIDMKPRLQLLNSKRDSDILLGVGPKKRKRKSSEASSVSLDSISMKKELSKKKTALAKACYEEFSQRSAQESSSLHNETLTSLKSPSEKSEKGNQPINFNTYGVKELKKKYSHKLDKNKQLPCHKLTYRNCSQTYMRGVHFLSPIKLYSILYLGLLIGRSQIQLGDFLRFIREGHLTFNNYTELFPEEYAEKFLNIQNNNKNNLFSNKSFRITTAKIAIFLNVATYIQVVDLTALCERFCTEMNLPDDVYAAVRNIISKVNPKLSFNNKSKIIPNYEGRVMSIILFTLKLLYGLDGVTEWEMSKYAQSVNKLNYMESSSEIDSDKFLSYFDSQGIKLDENVKLTKEMAGYKELLTKIVENQDSNYNDIKFMPTLTPYLEYSRLLKSPNLSQSFHDNSLDYLLRPNKYLHLVSGGNLQLKHGGANDDWRIEELKTYRKMKLLSRKSLRLIPVEISKDDTEENIDEAVCSKPKVSKKNDPLYVQELYHECRKHVFQKNETYVNRISKHVKLDNEIENVKKSDCYNAHYIPYERYWLYLQMHTHCINKTDFGTFFNKHTDTFKLVFNECARIIEQTAQEFLHEFQYSELFLVFSATYGESNNLQQKRQLLDSNLKYYVNSAKMHW
ncbi:TATA box-binding protein-associated factor RNA polymerase I subunit B isoform X2 [Anoplophora glabripennis]|uniref:TATA box-binding protein-associated factor RNA polymerase I subunit B isoform X2 n=1 Tax=Anoplophora glabripennis TaxID=217634 RepID=UPI0008750924|nr:TATA box-binding protein-associated factor RNA polymerase I subunit B isoform X2 [Anoplophora glabripennis]